MTMIFCCYLIFIIGGVQFSSARVANVPNKIVPLLGNTRQLQSGIATVKKIPNKWNKNVVKVMPAANLARVKPLNTITNRAINTVGTNIANTNQILANTNLMNNVGGPAIRQNTFATMPARMQPQSMQLNVGNPYGSNSALQGKIGNQNFGLQVRADNLEIGGTVSVTGQMPIYGAVTVNGRVPTEGKATVNYSCGSPT